MVSDSFCQPNQIIHGNYQMTKFSNRLQGICEYQTKNTVTTKRQAFKGIITTEKEILMELCERPEQASGKENSQTLNQHPSPNSTKPITR